MITIPPCPRCGDLVEVSDRFCSSCGQDLVTYRNLWPPSPPSPTPVATTPARASAPLSVTPAEAPTAAVAPDSAAQTPRIPTYLGWAAALTALCWPAFWAGIPALTYAGRAETRQDEGDLAGAQEAAERAKTWCWVTFWAGLVLWAVALTLVVTL